MNNLTERQLELIQKYCDQSMTDEEHKEFMSILEESAEVRKATRQFLTLDSHLTETFEKEVLNSLEPSDTDADKEPIEFKAPKKSFAQFALVAGLSFVAGLLVLWSFNLKKTPKGNQISDKDPTPAQKIIKDTYAVIEKAVDVKWVAGSKQYQNGATLSDETLEISEGILHLEFFCGASVLIEGPAKIDLQSPWEAFCHKGKIKAKVPRAARGFTIYTNETKVVDLGTEFGLSVGEDGAKVEVFDGKVRLDNENVASAEITAGQGMIVKNGERKKVTSSDSNIFIDKSAFDLKAQSKTKQKYDSWQQSLNDILNDPTLIAYYSMTENDRMIQGISGMDQLKGITDGKIIQAESSDSRWGSLESNGSIGFRKHGSRVRVSIPGTFQAITFASWVRIDSLNRSHNGLFLTDGYERGEPHWQLNPQGQIFLGYMVNEELFGFSKEYQYRHYSVKRVWTPSMSGQWIHLVSSYSPENKEYKHYLNGKLVDQKSIPEEFIVKEIKLGNSEIGNWGQPIGSKSHPSHIRNMNGRIDDMMLFNRALTDEDVKQLYEQSSH